MCYSFVVKAMWFRSMYKHDKCISICNLCSAWQTSCSSHAKKHHKWLSLHIWRYIASCPLTLVYFSIVCLQIPKLVQTLFKEYFLLFNPKWSFKMFYSCNSRFRTNYIIQLQVLLKNQFLITKHLSAEKFSRSFRICSSPWVKFHIFEGLEQLCKE